MERGRTFYISLLCGLVAFALMLVSMNMSAQLVFETKPYARVVLMSGKLENWTAESLGLEQIEFDMVKDHYTEFLKRNKADSSDSFSDDSDSEDEDVMPGIHTIDGAGNETYDHHRVVLGDSSDSFSSSDEEGGMDSDDSEAEQQTRLADAPRSQHVGLGLFHGRICETSQDSKERCHSVSTNEAIYRLSHEAHFMINNINMAIWNNLRVESIFAVLACAIGLLFLFAALRPCCDNHRLPQYLSAIAFSASGVLVFIPIVRLMLVSSDFTQNLQADYIVTTKLMTPWSLVVAGLASPFALVASFAVIATKWVKVSKKLYHKLHPRHLTETGLNGHVVEMSDRSMESRQHPPAYADINNGDERELIDDKKV